MILKKLQMDSTLVIRNEMSMPTTYPICTCVALILWMMYIYVLEYQRMLIRQIESLEESQQNLSEVIMCLNEHVDRMKLRSTRKHASLKARIKETREMFYDTELKHATEIMDIHEKITRVQCLDQPHELNCEWAYGKTVFHPVRGYGTIASTVFNGDVSILFDYAPPSCDRTSFIEMKCADIHLTPRLYKPWRENDMFCATTKNGTKFHCIVNSARSGWYPTPTHLPIQLNVSIDFRCCDAIGRSIFPGNIEPMVVSILSDPDSIVNVDLDLSHINKYTTIRRI